MLYLFIEDGKQPEGYKVGLLNITWYLLYGFESRSGEVYSIQHYVIKFVSDLRQFVGFLRVLRISPPINLTVSM